MAELRSVLVVFLANFFFKLPEGVNREGFIEEHEVAWVSLQIKDGLFLKVTPIVADQQKSNGWVHEE